jgi:hypothetical protein
MEGQSRSLTLDLSKLKMPNTEFIVYVAALIVAIIVTAAWKAVDIAGWFQFFLVTTAFYLVSRGIAKAHNVHE